VRESNPLRASHPEQMSPLQLMDHCENEAAGTGLIIFKTGTETTLTILKSNQTPKTTYFLAKSQRIKAFSRTHTL